MDFFGHQDRARSRTGKLVALFVLATVLVVASVTFAVAGIVTVAMHKHPEDAARMWTPEVLGSVAVPVLVVIALGSLYKILSLRGGGATVAQMLGGRLVSPDTRAPDERKLLNVVEEMSIAAGIPVPPVYLLDEERGINAFAAGFTVDDAVIGVTAGAAELLTRDELQGVIAHEYSHILNGDMRLSLRLIGVLHGILMVALAGGMLLRSLRHIRGGKKSGQAMMIVLLLGVTLFVIGYIGVFVGKLIKLAASRQRELLADASAVQFTRNPAGLAGALKKMGGLSRGSALQADRADEASHLYFGEGIASRLDGLMSTHPPLLDRIRRIEPSFNGVYEQVERKAAEPEAPRAKKESGFKRLPIDPMIAVAAVGTLEEAAMAEAVEVIDEMPALLREAVRSPLGAAAAVFALIADGNASLLADLGPDGVLFQKETQRLLAAAEQCPDASRLPLVEMAMPSLKLLSPAQYGVFRAGLTKLSEADSKTSLFEYVLSRAVERHLAPAFEGRRAPPARLAMKEVRSECGVLLSALARVGSKDSEGQGAAFEKGARWLSSSFGVGIEPPAETPGFTRLDESLARLEEALPPVKKKLLEACVETVRADGTVTTRESELLRAVSDALGCPMPLTHVQR